MVIFVVVMLIGLPAFFLFYHSPTCFDGKQNGDETGVDCGGSCQLLCKAESLPLILKGDPRVLAVSSTTYQVVALIENPDNTAEIYHAGYIIRVYDAGNAVPLKVIEGETYAPKGATFAILEGPFSIESGGVPKRAILEWKENSFVWEKNASSLPHLEIQQSILSRGDSAPRLDVMLQNFSLKEANNIDLVALLSDGGGNIFAASQTFIDRLGPSETAPAVFTWPRPFGQEAISTNIVIRIFPDRSFIK